MDNAAVWKDFVSKLRCGGLTADNIRTFDESLKKPILKFLEVMKDKIELEELEFMPEIYQVGNQVNYLIPLTFEGKRTPYCFKFIVEEKKWYLRHMESIMIRLDKISSFPASTFPDLSEDQKAWIREEIHVTEQVYLFNFLLREKGKDFAFSWFKDGAGYFLMAKTWVPFVPEPKAFILFTCWEQANLRGNYVTLEKLEAKEAIIRMKSNYFQLFKRTGHLKQQISFEDYKNIFEIMWQDRANNAGWDLQIIYKPEDASFISPKRSSIHFF